MKPDVQLRFRMRVALSLGLLYAFFTQCLGTDFAFTPIYTSLLTDIPDPRNYEQKLMYRVDKMFTAEPSRNASYNILGDEDTTTQPILQHDNKVIPHSTPLTLNWLSENYEFAEGVCIPRNVIYKHYCDFCQKNGMIPVNPASFGKVRKLYNQ
jgi:hypothetical protein